MRGSAAQLRGDVSGAVGVQQVAQRDAIAQALFWAYVAALAWCPFWFGSNALVAWGINAILFPGLAVLYEISLLVRGKRHPVGVRQLTLPVALFAAVVVWIVIQNATWTPSTLHHPVWSMSAEALERPIESSISVNRDLTTLALARLITVASAFWIALQLSRDAYRAQLLIKAVVLITCIYSAYGLIAFALTPGYTLWMENAARGSVTSTFFNRNSFATYAGIGLVSICALILRLYRHEVALGGGPMRLRIASFIETTGRQGAVLLGGAFLILVALLLTGSRGGIIATCLGLFVLTVLTFGRRRKGAAEQIETIAFVTLLVAAAFLAFGDVFIGNIAGRGIYDQGRIAVYKIVLGSIMDTPILGYGYGTFSDIFPMFRDRSISTFGTWEMAHNTYLEIFQGLGLAFGSMLLGAIALLVGRCMKAATLRQENATIPAVAASVGFLVGVHSLVDFSLQIQAVALTFAALLGAGVAQSASSRIALHD